MSDSMREWGNRPQGNVNAPRGLPDLSAIAQRVVRAGGKFGWRHTTPIEWAASYGLSDLQEDFHGLLERSDALAVCLGALESRSDWRGMETAPKDSMQSVLLWVPGIGEARIGYFLTQSAASACWWISAVGAVNPTHWMPLPAPPVAASVPDKEKP